MRKTACLLASFALVAASGTAFAQSPEGTCISPGAQDFESATPTVTASCSLTSPGDLTPTGWSLDLANSTNAWRVRTGRTPSTFTGPSGDNTTGSGNYLFTETSSCGGQVAIVNSPCFDASGLANPTVAFFYHMWGSDMGSLELQQDDGVGGWVTIWSLSGDQGNSWQGTQVPFTETMPGATSFRFVGTAGPSFNSDMAIDDFSVGEFRFPQWETNDSGSSLNVDGANVSDLLDPINGGAVSMNTLAGAPLTASGSFGFSTDLSGGFDIAVNSSPTVPVSANLLGARLVDGQFVNVDLTVGIGWVNGGGAPNFSGTASIPGLPRTSTSISANYETTSPLVASLQAVAQDPSQPTGLRLSAAAQLSVMAPAGFQTGPNGDDSTIDVSLAMAGDGDLEVYGNVVTDLGISSNGRIFFGAGNANGDFSPSIADAMSQSASLNFWSDLSPNVGGQIYALPGPGADEFTVQFLDVPFFGEGATANTWAFVVNTATNELTIDGLSGTDVNPASFANSGDNQFLGLSQGGGLATDAGIAGFDTGLSGPVVLPTDMLYDFFDAQTLGGPVQFASIAGGMNSITFTPDGLGGYTWSAF